MGAGPEFFQTIMGSRFFEGTMPKLVREIEALNGSLSKVAEGQMATAVVIAGLALANRRIMILPSRDGENYQEAMLTPVGVTQETAYEMAEEVLSGLEHQEEVDPSKDWDYSTLAQKLEARGFIKLEAFLGPTWDRKG